MSSELVIYSRILKMALPPGQSAFLWGARKTGKSTYLKNQFPNSLTYDLLESDLFNRLLKEPHLLREQMLQESPHQLKNPVIIDEIQKIPPLLDEVHWLIENQKIQFILCGSSARKLKRGQANLLGGRAWRYLLAPLTSREIPNLDLLRALNTGLLPSHYLSADPKKSLQGYIYDYLKEEIQAEGLTRNLPAFARFLDAAAYSNSELVNYSNIARDCGVDMKTVREYHQILVDTHLGHLIEPYRQRKSRALISSAPKFYFFDVGVAMALSKSGIAGLRGETAGKAMEHFMLMEMMAYRGYQNLDFDISFWRTKTGLEVDFVLGTPCQAAIEVKISDRVNKSELHGLAAFLDENKPKKAIVVCREKKSRTVEMAPSRFIEILPWTIFLDRLWNKEIV